MSEMEEKQNETPLTASVDKAKNISTLKVLYTNRVNKYSDVGLHSVLKPDFPWTVGISPTSRCPRKCFFCSHSQRNRFGLHLSEHVMQQIHSDIKAMGVKGVIYAGGGDPFAWEHDVVSYMEMAANFCCVGIDTNGVLAQNILASNVATKIFYITFALLGNDAYLYKQVCGQDQFRVVDNNIRQLVNRKRKLASHYPHINVKLSINQRSYRHMIDMWHYASGLGVDNIFARSMNNFEENQDVELTPEQKRELHDLIVNSSDFPDNYKHAFAQNLIYPAQFTGHLPSRCWSVLLGHNLGIKQDGECYLCVPTSGLKEFSIGNVNQQSIAELWGSKRHLDVIRRLDERMRKGGCDPNKCRHFRLNLVLEGSLRGQYKCPEQSKFMEMHAAFL
ncbi:MAG: hypothetical protein QG639_627 [Patescibacteria group bacterium]|nr:hypothetical protein [Patescibacteria group bacterium]